MNRIFALFLAIFQLISLSSGQLPGLPGGFGFDSVAWANNRAAMYAVEDAVMSEFEGAMRRAMRYGK
ncbi:hypothetical protein GCK32_006587 [Trichostrongylus colubriformis]|uniref:Uncharacterized protein n=1 Tax=Trichostrongylus colubriformis TaxID=6319 RepID=A0AAN8GB82_TRICO